jgi:phage-related tail fiber protein
MTQVDRIDGFDGALAFKAPCKCASASNITLSGLLTIDGYAVQDQDRVLVNGQTDQTQNGIWTASAAGAWTRALDCDGARDVMTGSLVSVVNGTLNAGTLWKLASTDNPIVFNTSLITWAPAGFLVNTGTIDGGTF